MLSIGLFYLYINYVIHKGLLYFSEKPMMSVAD